MREQERVIIWSKYSSISLYQKHGRSISVLTDVFVNLLGETKIGSLLKAALLRLTD